MSLENVVLEDAPLNNRASRIIITEKNVGKILANTYTETDLGVVLKLFNEARKEIINLYDMERSTPEQLRLLKDYLVPAMTSAMGRFGVSMRSENNAIRMPKSSAEAVNLVQAAIDEENQNCQKYEHPQRACWQDMLGIEPFLNHAQQALETQDTNNALVWLRQATAIAGRAVSDERVKRYEATTAEVRQFTSTGILTR